MAFRPSSGPAGVGSALTPPSPKMNEPSSEQPEINISVSQICALINVSRLTFDRMCDRGEGPKMFLLGKRKFSTPSLIKSWIIERQRGASASSNTAA